MCWWRDQLQGPQLVARSPWIHLTLPISKSPWCLLCRVDSLSSATLQFDWEGCPVRLRTQAERGLLWHHSYTNRWRQLRTLARSLVISFSRALASLKIIYVWSVNPWQPLSTAVPNVVPRTVSCLFPLQGSIFGVLYTSMFSLAPASIGLLRVTWKRVYHLALVFRRTKICSFIQWQH